MVLTHYDPEHPLKLACDPLSVGVRTVLFHVMEDGSEQPIAFASRTLTKAERNYSQIVKEALVTRSHQSLPWTLILPSQCRTRYSMETAYRSAQGNCSRNTAHGTPQLHPPVLVGIPQGKSCVRSKEPQPPFVNGAEETPTINRDENSSSSSPLSSQNKIIISSSATPPPRRYPLRLRKPPEKLNL